jgi:hypothetical protein
MRSRRASQSPGSCATGWRRSGSQCHLATGRLRSTTGPQRHNCKPLSRRSQTCSQAVMGTGCETKFRQGLGISAKTQFCICVPFMRDTLIRGIWSRPHERVRLRVLPPGESVRFSPKAAEGCRTPGRSARHGWLGAARPRPGVRWPSTALRGPTHLAPGDPPGACLNFVSHPWRLDFVILTSGGGVRGDWDDRATHLSLIRDPLHRRLQPET